MPGTGTWNRHGKQQKLHVAGIAAEVETPFEKRIVTLIYKRKFSKVLLKKQMRLLRKSFQF